MTRRVVIEASDVVEAAVDGEVMKREGDMAAWKTQE